jgi:hypothetical protein
MTNISINELKTHHDALECVVIDSGITLENVEIGYASKNIERIWHG